MQPGRATLAEMVAFGRLASISCARLAPDVESFRALALQRLAKPPLTEKEIVDKEKEVKQLRNPVGHKRWCQRYTGPHGTGPYPGSGSTNAKLVV